MIAFIKKGKKTVKRNVFTIASRFGTQVQHYINTRSVSLLKEDISDTGQCWIYENEVSGLWKLGSIEVVKLEFKGEIIHKKPEHNDRPPL